MDIKDATIEELETRLMQNREFFLITPVVEERRKLITEDHEIFLEIDRRLNNALSAKPAQSKRYCKFVRYKEGAELYGMCEKKFIRLAKDAKAVYKVDRLVLVNTELIEEYLESFHINW